jgi:hypothetical protein
MEPIHDAVAWPKEPLLPAADAICTMLVLASWLANSIDSARPLGRAC